MRSHNQTPSFSPLVTPKRAQASHKKIPFHQELADLRVKLLNLGRTG
ncbi:hypothetical protein B932_0683 [Gluconobacter oxydans H24]|nr:hypothetical protein B932_0683 [Gluconobacter oxydans H24]GAC89505.1 hypothetical protein NBRC3255_3166 [Gluconobacter thailandicus NBRC 3255]